MQTNFRWQAACLGGAVCVLAVEAYGEPRGYFVFFGVVIVSGLVQIIVDVLR